jgi:hypothetical protein
LKPKGTDMAKRQDIHLVIVFPLEIEALMIMFLLFEAVVLLNSNFLLMSLTIITLSERMLPLTSKSISPISKVIILVS